MVNTRVHLMSAFFLQLNITKVQHNSMEFIYLKQIFFLYLCDRYYGKGNIPSWWFDFIWEGIFHLTEATAYFLPENNWWSFLVLNKSPRAKFSLIYYFGVGQKYLYKNVYSQYKQVIGFHTSRRVLMYIQECLAPSSLATSGAGMWKCAAV